MSGAPTVKEAFFDSRTEGKEAPKTSKADTLAYRWYGSVRFVQ